LDVGNNGKERLVADGGSGRAPSMACLSNGLSGDTGRSGVFAWYEGRSRRTAMSKINGSRQTTDGRSHSTLLALVGALAVGFGACADSDSTPAAGGDAGSGSSGGGTAGSSGTSTSSGSGSTGGSGGRAGSSGSSGSSGGTSGGTSGSGSTGGSSGGGSGTSSGGGTASSTGGSTSGGGSGGSSGGTADDGGAGTGAKFDHFVVILMENHSFDEIYGTAKYMTQLADQNVLLQNYSSITHPSEPNYLAIVSGQTFDPPSGDDNYHVFMGKNLVDGLESVGKTWSAYTESASGPCDTNNPDIRHVPFLFFDDVASNPARCNRAVPTTPGSDTEFVAELNSATPSNFIWLTPNDNNNMHDGTVAQGDAYIAALVPQILSSATFMTKRAALFIVFDEGSGSATFPNDPVYAILAGPTVKKAMKTTTAYSHYSVLSTLEANWGFASLGAKDVGAPSMLGEAFQ
jgi:hypothetical protein